MRLSTADDSHIGDVVARKFTRQTTVTLVALSVRKYTITNDSYTGSVV